MNRALPFLSLAAAALMAASASAKLPKSAKITPTPVLITNDYTEGVVVDRQGNLFFSHGKEITRITPDGKADQWIETGAPNGHKILPDGDHLVCDGSHHAVLRLNASGKIIGDAAIGKAGDLDIRTPNDLSLDPKGGFYFTDSVPETGAVIWVGPKGEKKIVARNVDFANGVALSHDRKRLYYGESRKNRIMVVNLKHPGIPSGKPKILANLPTNKEKPGWEFNQPDGMALDASGRLWVAHYGMKAIQVLSPKGKLLATYDGGNRTTSNVCFAGDNFETLYATGGEPGGVFRLDVHVPGLPLLP
jgi:gluconolactonase